MTKNTLSWSIWILWLILVIAWNYGFPHVDPIWDVIVAVILSFATKFLGKYAEKNK